MIGWGKRKKRIAELEARVTELEKQLADATDQNAHNVEQVTHWEAQYDMADILRQTAEAKLDELQERYERDSNLLTRLTELVALPNLSPAEIEKLRALSPTWLFRLVQNIAKLNQEIKHGKSPNLISAVRAVEDSPESDGTELGTVSALLLAGRQTD